MTRVCRVAWDHCPELQLLSTTRTIDRRIARVAATRPRVGLPDRSVSFSVSRLGSPRVPLPQPLAAIGGKRLGKDFMGGEAS